MTIYKKVPRKYIPLSEGWTLTEGSQKELEKERLRYKTDGVCENHLYVTITDGWLYDDCVCEICGHHSFI